MLEKGFIQRYTSLSTNLLGLCRFLRTKGLPISPQEESELLEALALIPFSTPENLLLTCQAVLVKQYKHLKIFKEGYVEFWQNLLEGQDAKIKTIATPNEKPVRNAQNQTPTLDALKSWLFNQSPTQEIEIAGYSPLESFTQRDFSQFTTEELAEIVRLIRLLAQTFAQRQNRRFRASSKPKYLDFRRTLATNLQRGEAEILHLRYKKRKIQPVRLLLLCDVSKSMDLYTRFLLQMLYAFRRGFRQIETFVFSTTLQRISDELNEEDIEKSLKKIAENVPHWAGGTKIGESLHTFLIDFASKCLDRQTVVLILSDGWDTGDLDLLAVSMRQIHRKAGRVIWLNPLAGNPTYTPASLGMEIALPFTDVFAPIHNLASMKAILKELKIGKRKKYKNLMM